MGKCAICENNKGTQACFLEASAVCVPCCLKVKNVYLCQSCKWFEKPRGAGKTKPRVPEQ